MPIGGGPIIYLSDDDAKWLDSIPHGGTTAIITGPAPLDSGPPTIRTLPQPLGPDGMPIGGGYSIDLASGAGMGRTAPGTRPLSPDALTRKLDILWGEIARLRNKKNRSDMDQRRLDELEALMRVLARGDLTISEDDSLVPVTAKGKIIKEAYEQDLLRPNLTGTEKALNRGLAVVGLIGSTIQIAGGILMLPCCPAGGAAVIAHGIDNAWADAGTLADGEHHRTMTSKGVQAGAEALGVPSDKAEMIGELTNAGLGIASGLKADKALRNGGLCFAAGTSLRTADGGKLIEEFQIGDKILARDDEDPEGSIVEREVTDLIRRFGTLWRLVVNGKEILTTAEHPFWVIGTGWVEAGQLCVGDRLRTMFGSVTVDVSEDSGETGTVYNLTVQEDHSYFVGADDWGWDLWVHNVGVACVKKNKEAGDAVRDKIAAREAPAKIEQSYDTVGGIRRVDVVKEGEEAIGIESKVGR
jgi:hypothetical protein